MTQARRFGGTFSPGGPGGPRPQGGSRWSGRAASSVSTRALLLFLLPTPLLLGAFGALAGGRAGATVLVLAAYAALMAGAHMTREGLKAAQAWEASALARAPVLPRKLIGAALSGAGVFLAAMRGGGSVVEPAILGALAAGLHVAAFGPDPMRAKGLAGLEGVALEEAVTRLETARGLIAEMRAAAEGFGDRALTERVDGLARGAEAVLAELERDPGDIRRARRFLAVYLVGARDATVRFAQARAESRDDDVAARYADLLKDLESHFARHRNELASNDRAALDVEIEVLRDRLKMEGV